MDRRVPERELLPSYKEHRIIEEEESEEPGRENEETESETEIIPEIIPRRRGRPRKKKEIIQEIPEKQVVREEKRRRKNSEETEPEPPTREIWSEDENELHTIRNKNLTLPLRFHHIDMWNNWAEKFSGYVTDHSKNGLRFKIQEHETKAQIWVELKKLNYWEYKPPPPDSGGFSYYLDGTPTPQAQITVAYIQDEYELML